MSTSFITKFTPSQQFTYIMKPLVLGLFSRGKSQLLRLAGQLLLQMINIDKQHTEVGPQAIAGTSCLQQHDLEGNNDNYDCGNAKRSNNQGSQHADDNGNGVHDYSNADTHEGNHVDGDSDGDGRRHSDESDDVEKDDPLPPVIFKEIALQQKNRKTTIAVAHFIVRASINQLCK